MNISIYIERLILAGVNIPPSQRPLLQASLETELARLLTDGGVSSRLAGGSALPHISAKGIQMLGNNDPLLLGQQIAQSVYREIGNE
jgi:hypothetical protein